MGTPLKESSVLWIEDQTAMIAPLVSYLRINQCRVDVVANRRRGLELARRGSYDLLILDQRLPDTEGIELLRQLRREGTAIPAVLVTGFGTIELAVEAMRLGAIDVKAKPVRSVDLLETVRLALASRTSLPGVGTSWTTPVAASFDHAALLLADVDSCLSTRDVAQLQADVGRALGARSATILDFLTGCSAFKVLVTAGTSVGLETLIRARDLTQVRPISGALHPKVSVAISRLESAPREAQPVHEGEIATAVGLTAGYLGHLLREQTGFGWDRWTEGAHLRHTVRALIEEDWPIERIVKDCRWSSRQRLHESMVTAIGTSALHLRQIMQGAGSASKRTRHISKM